MGCISEISVYKIIISTDGHRQMLLYGQWLCSHEKKDENEKRNCEQMLFLLKYIKHRCLLSGRKRTNEQEEQRKATY